MRNAFFILIALFLGVACKEKQSEKLQLEQKLTQLKDSTAVVTVAIDHEKFYSDSATFTGRVSLADNMFRIDLFDQYEDNTMMIFQGKMPYAKKALRFEITQENKDLNSVMIGKMIDKAQNVGSGYVMTEGKVEIASMNRNQIILQLSGKVMHYATKKIVACSGNLIFKKPTYLISNLKDEEIFY